MSMPSWVTSLAVVRFPLGLGSLRAFLPRGAALTSVGRRTAEHRGSGAGE